MMPQKQCLTFFQGHYPLVGASLHPREYEQFHEFPIVAYIALGIYQAVPDTGGSATHTSSFPTSILAESALWGPLSL